ncbi:hypothetical protein OSB04_024737 [Centaurea solstitialis]|uniref:Reverse transcriptase Ty1/copia-type domain-containing protein n=1 Tax=Centaurea solstitialis TaxID=347529 RepID=A0AA38WAN1_9ASTR|nr:hypothetical protein OSB04_024737 [Centaurea solstitialis]
MQEELLQFDRNHVWTLVPLPTSKLAIGTKWVFGNKKDEHGVVVRNKAILVAQGYCQEEDIDYDETIVPVARLEALPIFLDFTAHKWFKVMFTRVYQTCHQKLFPEIVGFSREIVASIEEQLLGTLSEE